MKVTYSIDGALIDVLRVVAEVKAITGMVPEDIETDDGQIIQYSDVVDKKQLSQ